MAFPGKKFRGGRGASRESWITTSNLPEAWTCKPERIKITGPTSWMMKLKYTEAGDRRIEMNTYWIPTMCQAPSSTVPLYITEAKFTQPASEEDWSSRQSQGSFHASTSLSGHAGFTAFFRHCLGNSFGQGPNTKHSGIGSLSTSGKHSLGRPPHRGRACESAQLCLSSMTSPPPATSSRALAISVELLVWRRQRQVGKGDKAGQVLPGQPQNFSLSTGQRTVTTVLLKLPNPHYLGSSTHHFLLPEQRQGQGRAGQGLVCLASWNDSTASSSCFP